MPWDKLVKERSGLKGRERFGWLTNLAPLQGADAFSGRCSQGIAPLSPGLGSGDPLGRAGRDAAKQITSQPRLRFAFVPSILVFLAVSLLALSLITAHTYAAEITLRLVRADAPDQLVSTAITKIDLAAESAKPNSPSGPPARPGTPADAAPKDAEEIGRAHV